MLTEISLPALLKRVVGPRRRATAQVIVKLAASSSTTCESDDRDGADRTRERRDRGQAYVREPQEAAEHTEQRPHVAVEVLLNVGEGVDLEAERQAAETVAHPRSNRRFRDGVQLVEVVRHVGPPIPGHAGSDAGAC